LTRQTVHNKKYGIVDCYRVSTPIDPGLILTNNMCTSMPEETAYMQTVPYLSAVGVLIYSDPQNVFYILLFWMSSFIT
jgi:hypothetical protein